MLLQIEREKMGKIHEIQRWESHHQIKWKRIRLTNECLRDEQSKNCLLTITL